MVAALCNEVSDQEIERFPLWIILIIIFSFWAKIEILTH